MKEEQSKHFEEIVSDLLKVKPQPKKKRKGKKKSSAEKSSTKD